MTSFFKQPPSISCARLVLMRLPGSAGHRGRMSRPEWADLTGEFFHLTQPGLPPITALTYILRLPCPKPVCTRAVTDGW